jgi:hypothetical protein
MRVLRLERRTSAVTTDTVLLYPSVACSRSYSRLLLFADSSLTDTSQPAKHVRVTPGEGELASRPFARSGSLAQPSDGRFVQRTVPPYVPVWSGTAWVLR